MQSYEPITPTTDQYRSGWPFGAFGARGNSTSHWLRSGGGKTCADAIYTGPSSKEEKKRREKQENIQKWSRPLYLQFRTKPLLLRPSIPIARISHCRSLSEFARVVELLLLTWHRWELPLLASVIAIRDHRLYTLIVCSIICRYPTRKLLWHSYTYEVQAR